MHMIKDIQQPCANLSVLGDSRSMVCIPLERGIIYIFVELPVF